LYTKHPLSDAELLFTVEACTEYLMDPAMRSPQLRDVLAKEEPLSTAVLGRLLSDAQGLTSRDLRDLLLSNSPLPAELIPLLENAPPERLDTRQIEDVLRVQ